MKKYFKFLIIFLAVAIVIPQIALAAWWNPFSWGVWNRVFHFQKTEQKQEQQNKKDDTAYWKTYTNTQYGFEVKYPDDWSVNTITGGAYVYCDYQKRDLKACTGLSGVGIGSPGPIVNIKADKTSFDDFKKDWNIQKQQTYTLDGATGWKLLGNAKNGEGWDYYIIFVTKNNDSYIIRYPEFQKVDILQQIVSTFKFASKQPVVGGDKDEHGCIGSAGYTWCEAKEKCLRQWEEKCEKSAQSDEAAGWKKYTNAQYEFEFKYPNGWVISESSSSTVSVWSSEEKKQEAVSAVIPIYPEFSINYKNTSSFNEFAKGLLARDVSGVRDFVSSNFLRFAEIVVGGKKAYAVTSVANRAVYTVYIESENGVYILSAEDLTNGSFNPENPKIDTTVGKILSTFKFTK